MKKLLIRFNTENKGKLFWRVIIEEQEHLADEILLQVPSHTSQDEIEPGRVKFHISCIYNELEWKGTTLIVK